jgi:nucleoside-diphosphate-sugar epimerase
MGRRVVVIGATGNVGTALVRSLMSDATVEDVLCVARRPEGLVAEDPRIRTARADVTSSDLRPLLDGADAVIHLAWALQPAHDRDALHRTNVVGTERVLMAASDAQVGRVVVASSVGTYAQGPKDRLVGESWPATGVPTSTYSRQKAAIERLCDGYAARLRVIRLRPALIFQRSAAMEQRRLFGGRLLPTWPWRSTWWPFVPWVRGLAFQAVHADDVAEAYRIAAHADVDGAFNIAAEPVVSATTVAELSNARVLPVVPARVIRPLHGLAFSARLIASEPGWLDLACASPLIASDRARQELGWSPRHTSLEALDELAAGLRGRVPGGTPALAADA